MITKGKIISIPTRIQDNEFLVEVPIFETAGMLPKNPVVITCVLSYQPGNLNSYSVGDVVLVSFEDNKMSNGVILGKLYLNSEAEATTYGYFNALKVTGSVELPVTTMFGNQSLETLLKELKFAAHSDVNITKELIISALGYTPANELTLNSHIGDTDNPHEVTKTQVGLSDVDNTSDLDKPISTATQAALNTKQETLTFDTEPTEGSSNPVTSNGIFTKTVPRRLTLLASNVQFNNTKSLLYVDNDGQDNTITMGNLAKRIIDITNTDTLPTTAAAGTYIFKEIS